MIQLKLVFPLLLFHIITYNKLLVNCELLDSKVNIKEEIANITAYMREWATSLSQELASLSKLARKPEVEKSFDKYDINEENWNEIVEEVAENIRVMMKEKIKAVRAIKQHAELLSKHRKEDITRFSSYDYYDANNITQSEGVEDRTPDIEEAERFWKCSIPENLHSGRYDLCFDNSYKSYQSDEPFPKAMGVIDKFSYRNYSRLLSALGRCNKNAFLYRPKYYHSKMNMKYHAHFDEAVNLNYSIVRVTPTVYKRDDELLNAIRWSEALDLTFKCNFQRDPTLTYQYFGSPEGFMRFYPATKWSKEQYNDTIDFRVRSWYIEAIASAKDMVILVDVSGSMMSNRRRNISNQIVNSILDTLTDNDYVNIYTFNNKTQSLVDCFDNTLVQANEENLRLLRERLAEEKDPTFQSNITIGLVKAFDILRNYRFVRGGGTVCNQAIMLITEGVDYEGFEDVLRVYNTVPEEKYYRPVRIFTYLLGTEPVDAQRMTWIACANMGYYVNITYIEEVREKVLKYLEVLSRPINLNPHIEPEPAWTALYVHLTDRRHANWLWRKHEGNKQRDILIEYERKHIQEVNKTLKENQTHFTTQTEHSYEAYLKAPNYHYLTSVSLPVFDLSDKPTLLGVAGVDVPLDYLQQLAEPHRIGVNGYSFTITNNGYVLHHPDHRTEFGDHILKPTFNRVDVTEVEISDKTYEPRKFDQDIIDLREEIVFHKKRNKLRIRKLRIRQPIDDMKRVMVSSRHYFHTKIGPFSLVIALPDGYGFFVSGMKVDARQLARIKQDLRISLNKSDDWRVNPKWLYTCNSTRAEKSPEKELVHFLNTNATFCKEQDLVNALLKDAYVTEWFHQNIAAYNHVKQTSIYHKGVVLTFMATHTGLTRWKDLRDVKGVDHFADNHNKATDEIFYRRGAEMNYNKSHMFIYSVPFKEYNEATTLITASHVIFLKREGKRAPIAAVGYQILHKTLNKILKTFHCGKPLCNITCTGPNSWICYVIDNDGYIILANDTSTIGQSLADVDIPLMKTLVKNDVFKEITVFDYQGTCYPTYTKPRKEAFYGPGDDIINDKDKKCKRHPTKDDIKCKTLTYLRLKIKQTTPTPCDIELKMYNYQFRSFAHLHPDQNDRDCPCPYITEPIKGTNLLLLALDRKKMCCDKDSTAVPTKEYPKEIQYNLTLPCHIAVNNNFTKRHYTKCITKHVNEYKLNHNTSYCGSRGIVPLE